MPVVKWRRNIHTKDDSDYDVKRPRPTRQAESRTVAGKEVFIENWLDESSWSQKSIENEAQIWELLDTMPPNHAPVHPSPRLASKTLYPRPGNPRGPLQVCTLRTIVNPLLQCLR
jgi:hypothetical protein